MDSHEKTKLIKYVREKTLLPLAECGKILEEAGWDINNLDQIMSKYQDKLVGKKRDRETNEGKIFVEVKDGFLYFAFISCETDFVSTNEQFLTLGSKVITELIAGKSDFDALISEYVSRIGENLAIKKTGKFECNFYYLHNGKKLGAVKTNSNNEEFNKKLCFQIVAMGEIEDMSSIESFVKQSWYESPSKTVKDILNAHNVELLDLFCLII